MYGRIGATVVLAALALGSAGCATEEFVRNEIQKANVPIQAQLTQLETGAAQEKAAREQVAARLTRALSNRYNRELVETVSLRFATGQSKILPEHEPALQRVLKTLTDYTNYTADVVGYTDSVGTDAYNINLSWSRQEAVRRYLLEKGKVLHRVSFIGLGEDKSAPAARAEDRQVTIQIFRPIE